MLFFQPGKDQIIRVIDGDTVLVVRDGKKVRVRLAGIDAPESNSSYGYVTEKRFSELLDEGWERIAHLDTGPYGRPIDSFIVEGSGSISDQLISEGLARSYGDTQSIGAAGVQHRARLSGAGMWGDQNNFHIPPELVRRGYPDTASLDDPNLRRVNQYASSAADLLRSAVPPPSPIPEAPHQPGPILPPPVTEPEGGPFQRAVNDPNPLGYFGDAMQALLSGGGRILQAFPEVGAWASSGVGNLMGQEHGPFEQQLEEWSDALGDMSTDPFEEYLGPSRQIDPLSGGVMNFLGDIPIGVLEQAPQLGLMLLASGATGGLAAPIAAGIGMEAGSHRAGQRAAGHGDQDLGTLAYGLGAGVLESLGAKGVGSLGKGVAGRFGAGFLSEGITEGEQALYEQLIQRDLEQTQDDISWRDAATEALLGGFTGGGMSVMRGGPQEVAPDIPITLEHARMIQGSRPQVQHPLPQEILQALDQDPLTPPELEEPSPSLPELESILEQDIELSLLPREGPVSPALPELDVQGAFEAAHESELDRQAEVRKKQMLPPPIESPDVPPSDRPMPEMMETEDQGWPSQSPSDRMETFMSDKHPARERRQELEEGHAIDLEAQRKRSPHLSKTIPEQETRPDEETSEEDEIIRKHGLLPLSRIKSGKVPTDRADVKQKVSGGGKVMTAEEYTSALEDIRHDAPAWDADQADRHAVDTEFIPMNMIDNLASLKIAVETTQGREQEVLMEYWSDLQGVVEGKQDYIKLLQGIEMNFGRHVTDLVQEEQDLVAQGKSTKKIRQRISKAKQAKERYWENNAKVLKQRIINRVKHGKPHSSAEKPPRIEGLSPGSTFEQVLSDIASGGGDRYDINVQEHAMAVAMLDELSRPETQRVIGNVDRIQMTSDGVTVFRIDESDTSLWEKFGSTESNRRKGKPAWSKRDRGVRLLSKAYSKHINEKFDSFYNFYKQYKKDGLKVVQQAASSYATKGQAAKILRALKGAVTKMDGILEESPERFWVHDAVESIADQLQERLFSEEIMGKEGLPKGKFEAMERFAKTTEDVSAPDHVQKHEDAGKRSYIQFSDKVRMFTRILHDSNFQKDLEVAMDYMSFNQRQAVKAFLESGDKDKGSLGKIISDARSLAPEGSNWSGMGAAWHLLKQGIGLSRRLVNGESFASGLASRINPSKGNLKKHLDSLPINSATKIAAKKWLAAQGVFHAKDPAAATALRQLSENISSVAKEAMGTVSRLEKRLRNQFKGEDWIEINRGIKNYFEVENAKPPSRLDKETTRLVIKAKRHIDGIGKQIVREYDRLIAKATTKDAKKKLQDERTSVEAYLGSYVHGLYQIHMPVRRGILSKGKSWVEQHLQKDGILWKGMVAAWTRDRAEDGVEILVKRHFPDFHKDNGKLAELTEADVQEITGLSKSRFFKAYKEIQKGLSGNVSGDIKTLVDAGAVSAVRDQIERSSPGRAVAEHERDVQDLRELKGKSVWVSEKLVKEINERLVRLGMQPRSKRAIQKYVSSKNFSKGKMLDSLEQLFPEKHRSELAQDISLPAEIKAGLGEVVNAPLNYLDTVITSVTRLEQLKAFDIIRETGRAAGYISSVEQFDAEGHPFVRADSKFGLSVGHPLYGLWVEKPYLETIMGMDKLQPQSNALKALYTANAWTKMNSTVYRPMTAMRNVFANLEFFLSFGFAPNPFGESETSGVEVMKLYARAMKSAAKGDEFLLEWALSGESSEAGVGSVQGVLPKFLQMESTPEGRQKAEEAVQRWNKLGLIQIGQIRDLKDGINQANTILQEVASELRRAGFDDADLLSGKKPLLLKDKKKVQKIVRRLAKPMEVFYQAGDDVFRGVLFEMSEQRLLKEGVSKEDAEKIAVWDAKNMFPDYSKLPRYAQKLRRFPLVAPFIAWTVTSTMSLKNSMYKAGAELGYEWAQSELKKLDHPEVDWSKMRSIGIRRLGGITTAGFGLTAVSGILSAIVRSGMDWDDDEDREELAWGRNSTVEAYRALAGPWAENSNFIPLGGRDPSGDDVHIKALDASFLSVFDYAIRPVIAAQRAGLRNQTALGAFFDSLHELSDPFLGLELGAQGLVEAVMGSKYNGLDTKRPLLERKLPPEADVLEHMSWGVARLVKSGYLPGVVTAVLAVGESFGPHALSSNRKGKTPKTEAMAQFGGFRVQNMSMKDEVHYAVMDLAKSTQLIKASEMRNRSAGAFERLISGGDSVDRAERQFSEAVKDFQHQMWAVKRLSGWSTFELYDRILRDEKGLRLRKDQLWIILQGSNEYDPYVSLYSPKQREKMRWEMNYRRYLRQQKKE